jgi:hypothetical protein
MRMKWPWLHLSIVGHESAFGSLAENLKVSDLNSYMIPAGVKRVIVDVGTHIESDFLSTLDNDDELFLIGFEPLQSAFTVHPKLEIDIQVFF